MSVQVFGTTTLGPKPYIYMSVQVFGTTTLGPKPYILYVCSGLWYDHLGS